MTLLKSKGFATASQQLCAAQPDQSIVLSGEHGHFLFSWTRPAPEQENEEDQRLFFLQPLPPSPSAQEYEQLNKELQVIIDSLHDGIWVIDGEGRTVHVNKAMKRIAQLDPETVIGKHVTEPMHEGKFTTCVSLRALEARKPVTMFDDYACGTRCLNTSTPFFDAEGKVWRVVAAIRDMTELENLQKRLAEAEVEAHLYKSRLDNVQREQAAGFIANSKIMRNCMRELEKAAKAPSGILILGETGTGKTLTASLIHQKSPRAAAPFISVNCAAIPSSLIESELFGYERGAFTGAGQGGKKGFFELADKGTLLLDEIGELPLSMQAKLLHVLDNQTFHKIGGEKSIKVDIRIIAATNRPLEQLVASGDFRADLYYRLRVLSVVIPPLREHPEDIPELAMTFLEEACQRHGTMKTFSPKVLKCFSAHDWPGNVRELRAAVEFLAAMTEGSVIRVADLPPHILATSPEMAAFVADMGMGATLLPQEQASDLPSAVRALEKSLLRKALAQGGSTYKAAKILGISQSTVVRKMKELGIGSEK
ncbi:MAG: sigma 54-interacting transcriptional regulator [Desulfovibrionaceae bacterium]|nr:sigma 54-interacting transcriptional regulator [Desulfovibrionaceae bacterium]